MKKRVKTRGTARRLNSAHERLLLAIAKEAECSPYHALGWAVRTLADKRKIKFSS